MCSVLNAEETEMDKTDTVPAIMELTFEWRGEGGTKKKNQACNQIMNKNCRQRKWDGKQQQ